MSFYRSARGDELDLLIERGSRRIAIEIKRSLTPVPDAGVYRAIEATGADSLYIVTPGDRTYDLRSGGTVTGLTAMMAVLSGMSSPH